MPRLLLLIITQMTLLMLSMPVAGNDFVQRVFNAKDGLANSTINDISFDSYGFAWLATEQGLYRVSNSAIRRIDNVDNSSVLEDEMLYSVVPVTDEYLLITSGIALYLYSLRDHQFTELYQPSTQNSLTVATILANEQAQFEILTTNGQRYLFDVASKQLSVDLKGNLATELIWTGQLILPNQDRIYTSTHTAELHLANHDVVDLGWHKARGTIIGLMQDSKQRVWLFTSKGLFNVDIQQREIIPVEDKSYYIEKVVEDNHGVLWLGTRAGLLSWNVETNQTVSYRDSLKTAANINYIHALAIDSNGLIWVGGSGYGLALAATSPDFLLDTFSQSSIYQLSNQMVWSIYEQDNKVWLGTEGGLEIVDMVTKRAELILLEGFELNDSIYQINDLDQEHLVLSTTTGLFVVNKLTNQVIDFHSWSGGTSSLRDAIVMHTYPDPFISGRIWFSTNKGLFYWQTGETDLQPFTGNLDDKARFASIIRDSQQRLWLGGKKDLGYLDSSDQFVSIKEQVIYQDKQLDVAHLMEVSPNVFWIGTHQKGLLELNTTTGEITHLNERWNIECGVVLFLKETPDDFLIGCYRSIIQFNKHTRTPTSFTHYDGFISNEFNELAVYFQPEKGLFLGTPDGAMLIEPRLLANRIANNEAFLESVSIHYSDRTDLFLLPAQLKTVKPEASLISFQISNLDYLDESPMSLQYRLLKQGSPPSSFVLLEGKSQINISGISGGNYTLELNYKSQNVWSKYPFSFAFKVEEYWWQSQYFKGVLIFSVLFFAFFLSLYRQRQVMRFKKVNQDLIESDDRLSQALRGSDSDLWEWRDDSKMLMLDNRGGLLGGKSRIVATLDEVPVHPDDVERVTQAWLHFLKSKSDMIDVEYRYHHESGKWRWLRVKGRAISWHPTTGRLSRAAGIYSDVTVQRELESEIKLLAEAFENTSEGMLVLDADKRIKISNLAARRILATDESALLGQLFSNIVVSSQVPLNIDKLFTQATFWSGERELLCQSSQPCPVWLNISKMLSSEGDTQHYVVVFSDMTERKLNELKLQRLANNDSLTGLANRTQFVTNLKHVIEEACRNDEKLALLFLDLDRFKSVNDSYGHSMGDALLVEAANRLQSCLNSEHVLCRFGGDEFVILLRNVNDGNTINHIADKLLKQIEMPFKLYGREFFISTSIGISCWPEDCRDPEMLIKNADLAMYHAKEEGKGNFQYYSAERNAEALYHLRLEADLRKAIERNELELHYQPQIDILHNDRFIGMEALLRWKHPTEGYVRPDIFIKVAESCGFIIDIDCWVLKQACLDGARWHQHYQQDFKLSVNVSAVHFRQSSFIGFVKSTLAETGFPASKLCLEITEGVLMKELHVATHHLSQLKALGVQVAIDDFGTGYSSLAYLRTFEVNSLKIDRSFLIDIADNQADQAIVSSIIELARNLKLNVVAEGIETHEQLEQVFSRGCYIIQGYYFAKPMPRNDLDTFMGIDTKSRAISFDN